MRQLYLSTTVLFWLLVTAFWAGNLWLPPAEHSLAIAAEKVYSKADLAKHATADKCCMAIRGEVSNLNSYCTDHPFPREKVLEC